MLEDIAEQIQEEISTEPKHSKILAHKSRVAKRLFGILILVCIIAGGIFYYLNREQFKDFASFQQFILGFGYLGPIVLVVFQCLKVVYGIIPGAIGCLVGGALFGWWQGFVYNYIGICSGSLLVFLMSKKFGIDLISQIFSEKKYKAGMKFMNRWNKNYSVFLWGAICFPWAPDDFLCYISGLTDMKFKRFLIIILTAKPWTILGYSIISYYVGSNVDNVIQEVGL